MGRFDALKTDIEKSNPFKKGGNERPNRDTKYSRDRNRPRPNRHNDRTPRQNSINTKYEQEKGSSRRKAGAYIPPGARRRAKEEEQKRQLMFKPEERFREKEGDFPDLNTKVPSTQSNAPSTQSKAPSANWSAIVTNEEESEKPPPPEVSVKPGWVKLSRQPNTNATIKEYGDPTEDYLTFKKNLARNNIYSSEKRIEERIERYEEENEMNRPNDKYVYAWCLDDCEHHKDWLDRMENDTGQNSSDDDDESSTNDDDY